MEQNMPRTRRETAHHRLPAWFVPRMMEESGRFGLLLTSREVLGIERIDALHASIDGGIWLDVTLLSGTPDRKHLTLLLAATSGCRASINASHVVAAWELATDVT
jgi:hypothetical protein